MQKLERKNCDLIVVNGPEAIHAVAAKVEVLGRDGRVVGGFSGGKRDVARALLSVIQARLIEPA